MTNVPCVIFSLSPRHFYPGDIQDLCADAGCLFGSGADQTLDDSSSEEPSVPRERDQHVHRGSPTRAFAYDLRLTACLVAIDLFFVLLSVH